MYMTDGSTYASPRSLSLVFQDLAGPKTPEKSEMKPGKTHKHTHTHTRERNEEENLRLDVAEERGQRRRKLWRHTMHTCFSVRSMVQSATCSSDRQTAKPAG